MFDHFLIHLGTNCISSNNNNNNNSNQNSYYDEKKQFRLSMGPLY